MSSSSVTYNLIIQLPRTSCWELI